MATKLPSTPKAIEAEQALLGSVIIDSSAWEKISDRLSPNDFFDINNRAIYSEIYELASNGQIIDLLVLEEALKSKGQLEKIGGRDYLGLLTKIVPTSAHISQYANIIKEKSVMRELINISTKTIQNIHQSDLGDITEILDKTEQEIFNIAGESKTNFDLTKIGPVVKSYIEKIYAKKNNNELDYLLTGYGDLDKLLSGLQNSDLIVIAGRPSMGKTAFAMNIAQDIVFKQHKKVGFFSLEMTSESIALSLSRKASRTLSTISLAVSSVITGLPNSANSSRATCVADAATPSSSRFTFSFASSVANLTFNCSLSIILFVSCLYYPR